MKKLFFNFIILAVSLAANYAYAAVGCQLNDPDRDIKKIFPQSTGYKTDFISIQESGGKDLYDALEKALNDKLDPVFEAIDVPYAFYRILKGKETIGYVHGVNQKGMFGGMQLIVSTDAAGKIIDFYYQKISSPEAGKFMDKQFTGQFNGKDVKAFLGNAISAVDPSKNSRDDFKFTLRGLKKNMILLHQLELKEDILKEAR